MPAFSSTVCTLYSLHSFPMFFQQSLAASVFHTIETYEQVKWSIIFPPSRIHGEKFDHKTEQNHRLDHVGGK